MKLNFEKNLFLYLIRLLPPEKAIDYTLPLESISKALASYLAMLDIKNEENNIDLITVIFFENKSYTKKLGINLCLSKSSYYRKKQEYMNFFNLILQNESIEKLKQYLCISGESSVPNFGTQISTTFVDILLKMR